MSFSFVLIPSEIKSQSISLASISMYILTFIRLSKLSFHKTWELSQSPSTRIIQFKMVSVFLKKFYISQLHFLGVSSLLPLKAHGRYRN